MRFTLISVDAKEGSHCIINSYIISHRHWTTIKHEIIPKVKTHLQFRIFQRQGELIFENKLVLGVLVYGQVRIIIETKSFLRVVGQLNIYIIRLQVGDQIFDKRSFVF